MNLVTSNATSIRIECETCGSHRQFAWTVYDRMHDGEWVECPTCGVESMILSTAGTDLLARVG